MYSQNNEEQFIVDYFAGKTGRFLDIGAYNGKDLSNTYRLVELGWRGVCVEPSPYVFPALHALHKDNPNITLINAAVTSNGVGGLVPWYDSGGDAVSTTSQNHKIKWEAGSKVQFKAFHIYTMPLLSIFTSFGCDYEFINIDIEGQNFALFSALPWSMLDRTRFICVEHDELHEAISIIAAEHGFMPVARNAENLLLAR